MDKEKFRRAELWQSEDQIREWYQEPRREGISGVDSPCLVLTGVKRIGVEKAPGSKVGCALVTFKGPM